MRRLFTLLTVLMLCLLGTVSTRAAGGSAEAPLEIATLDSVTAQIVQFLGGPYIRVEATGTSRGAKKKFEAADYVFPLDREQYEQIPSSMRSGIDSKVRYLSPEGVRKTAQEFPFEPAILPYVAQQTAAVLGDVLPKRRSYFQRRLGEFDAKLNAVLATGRRRLNGRRILCASQFMIPFLHSFGADVRPVQAADYKIFSAAASAAEYKTAQKLLEPYKSVPLLLDWTTDVRVRNVLKRHTEAVVLSDTGGDLLHAIYTAILEL